MKLKTFYRFFFLAVVVAAIGISTIISAQTPEALRMGGVGLTVFTEANFRGNTQTFQNDVWNLAGTQFNDRISSLRVGPGEVWEVCEHANFAGRCVAVTGEESDLRRNNWNNIISSFRRVSGGGTPVPPPTTTGTIVLFDRTNFRGNSASYDRPTSTLGSRNRRAQSVTINGGPWQVCSGVNFTGRCITLASSTRNLATRGMSNRISSVRPVGNPGPPVGAANLVLFSNPNFSGSQMSFNFSNPNMTITTGSARVNGGIWQVCDGPSFSGRCISLTQSVSNLRSFPIGPRIHSVRLVQ